MNENSGVGVINRLNLQICPLFSVLIPRARGHAGKCLFNNWFSETNKEINNLLIFSPCWFAWCKYTYHGRFQTANLMSLNSELRRDQFSWSQHRLAPAHHCPCFLQCVFTFSMTCSKNYFLTTRRLCLAMWFALADGMLVDKQVLEMCLLFCASLSPPENQGRVLRKREILGAKLYQFQPNPA